MTTPTTFQTAYGILRTLNVTAAATTTNIVSVPVFSPNWTNAPINAYNVEALW